MKLVFCKVNVPLVDERPKFWTKLKQFVGEYRIEPHSIDEWLNRDIITISFYTDKVDIPEGESRIVTLEAREENGDWSFTEIIRL